MPTCWPFSQVLLYPSFLFFFFFRLILGLCGYIPILLTGNFRNGLYFGCLLSPWCEQESCFPQSCFCQHGVLGPHISCEPSKQHSPIPACYVLYHDWAGRTKIPFDRCLYVGLETVGIECALQTWYKKTLFNLINTSLGEMFVINVQFLPYMLEINCLLVNQKWVCQMKS